MKRYAFSAQAQDDLRQIGRYARKEWGLEQARRYREELELALQRLSLTPSIGRARDDLAPRLQSFEVAAHIAFFHADEERITIVRLLHPSMDVERLLHRRIATSGSDR